MSYVQVICEQHRLVEQHLDKSPNQYIQWRYATGEDREALLKVDRKITEEEEKKMKKAKKC